MIPVLEELADGSKKHRRAIIDAIALRENLPPEEANAKSARGTNIFRSRVHWAQAYLAQAGAISRPERGFMQITDEGREILRKYPNGITRDEFRKLPGYANAWSGRQAKNESPDSHSEIEINETPLEQIEIAIDQLEENVASELVSRIQLMTPKFLELVVLELLHKMGYGDSASGIEHLGGPGDEGVDGVINQDVLGLQRIYVQAKRYRDEGKIGRPEIQKFVGALTGLGANGGVFITTSTFSPDARDYAQKSQLSPRIILIDGSELGKLMVKHGVGVHEKRTYKVVDIDEDYFEED